MRLLLSTILLLLVCGLSVAQDTTEVIVEPPVTIYEPLDTIILLNDNSKDSKKVVVEEPIFVPSDTIILINGERTKAIKSVHLYQMGHSPHGATMFAAIVPGLGQIYNRKYWKLPIIYGGFAALCYSIHFNGKYYNKYRRAYRDFIIQDPNNKSYLEIVKKTNLTEEEVLTTYNSWFRNALKNKKDYYRRYRDLSYFGLAGVYLIQFLDAVVDAHFFKFDVDDNISLNWEPTIQPDDQSTYMGASVTISF